MTKNQPGHRSIAESLSDATRLIDHFVLVAKSLSHTRTYYQRLGFSVAADGVHPFGTHNANMYFRDGPMIETLSINNHMAYSEAIKAGNTFVKNDAVFRAAQGENGFSHIVVTSTDAGTDHKNFLAQGVSGGDIVSFSRQFKQPDGSIDTVAAKLAFATHTSAPYGFYFACEDIVVPEIDRSLLLDHKNGALGAKRVISCARKPSAYVDFLGKLLHTSEIRVNEKNVDCSLPNGRVSIVAPEVLAQEFGVTHRCAEANLLHRGLGIGVSDLVHTTALFTQNNIAFELHNDCLVVQTGPAPGPFFVFEQQC